MDNKNTESYYSWGRHYTTTGQLVKDYGGYVWSFTKVRSFPLVSK